MTFVREENVKILKKQPAYLDLETGRYEEQPDLEELIKGSVQPITAEMFSRMPEGIHFNDVKTLFVHVQLDDEDVIEVKNKRYKIVMETDWDSPSANIRHYVYVIKKEAVR